MRTTGFLPNSFPVTTRFGSRASTVSEPPDVAETDAVTFTPNLSESFQRRTIAAIARISRAVLYDKILIPDEDKRRIRRYLQEPDTSVILAPMHMYNMLDIYSFSQLIHQLDINGCFIMSHAVVKGLTQPFRVLDKLQPVTPYIEQKLMKFFSKMGGVGLSYATQAPGEIVDEASKCLQTPQSVLGMFAMGGSFYNSVVVSPVASGPIRIAEDALKLLIKD